MLIHAQAGGLITGSSFHRGMYKKTVPLGGPGKGGEGLQCVERTYEPEKDKSTPQYWYVLAIYHHDISNTFKKAGYIPSEPIEPPETEAKLHEHAAPLRRSPGEATMGGPWRAWISLLTTLPRHH